MKRADKPPVFTVASVLAHLMSQSALTDDAQSLYPQSRKRAATSEHSGSGLDHTMPGVSRSMKYEDPD